MKTNGEVILELYRCFRERDNGQGRTLTPPRVAGLGGPKQVSHGVLFFMRIACYGASVPIPEARML